MPPTSHCSVGRRADRTVGCTWAWDTREALCRPSLPRELRRVDCSRPLKRCSGQAYTRFRTWDTHPSGTHLPRSASHTLALGTSLRGRGRCTGWSRRGPSLRCDTSQGRRESRTAKYTRGGRPRPWPEEVGTRVEAHACAAAFPTSACYRCLNRLPRLMGCHRNISEASADMSLLWAHYFPASP